MSWKQRNSW